MELENRILEILMKETTSELSSKENAILTDFSGKNDINSAFLVENRAILSNLPSFGEDATSMFDVDIALTKVKSQIEAPTAQVRKLTPKAKIQSFNFQKWAAVALLLVGLGTIAYTFLGSPDSSNTFAAIDKIENITLSDGTEVVLNKNSTLTLSEGYGATLRDMKLVGEAYFKVKSDPDQPFTVKVGNLEVEVLGTQFNVDASESKSSTTVFVDEGKVKVTSLQSRTKVLLTAGESSTFDNKSFSLLKDKSKKYNATAWINNKLRFEDAELTQVIQEIEDHFGINVELKNSALTECKYTSIFNGAKADEVLETLSAVFDLQLMKEGDNSFELMGGNCN